MMFSIYSLSLSHYQHNDIPTLKIYSNQHMYYEKQFSLHLDEHTKMWPRCVWWVTLSGCVWWVALSGCVWWRLAGRGTRVRVASQVARLV